MNGHYNYKFTVIMPIYNSEKYLEEAIDSVVNQTIDFRTNIQLILVNNATEDSSGEICEKYHYEYPDNIKYIVLEENVGPSGARNAGIPFIEGKYTNFFDSDDKWSLDAFEKVWAFFEEHYDETDVVACRMKYFEALHGFYSVLDNKFDSDRISDLREHYMDLQLHVTSSFIKTEAIDNRLFDVSMKHLEDSKFINTIIIEKMTLGVLSSVIYNYRRHADGSSLLQNIRKENKYYYTHTMQNYLEYFVDVSKHKYKEVVLYIQWMIAYTIGFRLKERKDLDVLTTAEYDEYKNILINLLREVDDRIIMKIGTMNREYKMYALSLKHHDFYDSLIYNNGVFSYADTAVYSFRRKTVLVQILEIVDGVLELYGRVMIPHLEIEYNLYFEDDNGKKYYCKYDQYDRVKDALGKPIYVQKGFSVKIPLNHIKKIKPVVECHDEKIFTKMKFGTWAKLNDYLPNSYYSKDGFVIKSNQNRITVSENPSLFKQECKYIVHLFKKHWFKCAFFRILSTLCLLTLKICKKRIWLYADRFNSADDNGEFMYSYMINKKKNEKDKIISYYVIKKNSSDYSRLKKEGHILIHGSLKYNLAYSVAEVAFASVKRLQYTNYKGSMKDRCPNRVYLQHGIVEKDISDTWNRLSCNDKVFIASNEIEKEYFIKYNYGYTEREVKLTGMPRDDYLLEAASQMNQNHIICFAPTWRKQLVTRVNKTTGENEYNSDFKESEYYQFYNSLINDPRIIEAMSKNNYKGVLQLHPFFVQQEVDFDENDTIIVSSTDKKFVDKYKNVAMVITDYSSIAFEYALLGKPVVYTQFDKETFYSSHSYNEGFYDYEQDGFGPVCYDYENAVKSIVDLVNNQCEIGSVYKDRMIKTFKYTDGKNCERIYNEVEKMLTLFG